MTQPAKYIVTEGSINFRFVLFTWNYKNRCASRAPAGQTMGVVNYTLGFDGLFSLHAYQILNLCTWGQADIYSGIQAL